MCINLGIRNETRIIYWLRNLNLNMSSVADKKILFKENGLIFLRDVVYFFITGKNKTIYIHESRLVNSIENGKNIKL